MKSPADRRRALAELLRGPLRPLPAVDRLACACAASGYFVREARSASLVELAAFLAHDDWPDTSI